MTLPQKTNPHDTIADLTTGDLLALSRGILAELRRRGVIRSGNAPAGDYAELLVRRATGLPVGVVEPAARFVEHVSGSRVMATDALLDRGEDWTDRLRQAAEP